MFGDKDKKLKQVIKDNCIVKSVPVKIPTNDKKGKPGTITKRMWEVTDINLEPIMEEFEKHLKPKSKKEKKENGGE